MYKSKQKGKEKIRRCPLSNDELEKLSKTASGIVFRKDCRYNMKLQYEATPINSENFKKHVRKELNDRIMRYNTKLNDIILRICNVKILQPIEANRCRRLSVTCIADMYVFKPQCGSVLSAVVNKKSDGHLGCIMYDVFNVSILKPTELPYNEWPGKSIPIGSRVSFKVVKVDVSEVIPYIFGDLITSSIDSSFSRDEEYDSAISTGYASTGSAGTSDQCSEISDYLYSLNTSKPKKRKLSKSPSTKPPPAKKRRSK